MYPARAGKAMGLGDVGDLVIPKPVLISPAQKGGAIQWVGLCTTSCHRALAITGVMLFPVVVVEKHRHPTNTYPIVGYGNINTEHPSGALDVHLSNEGQDLTALGASVPRTTRKIFSGEVCLLPEKLVVRLGQWIKDSCISSYRKNRILNE
ncbi:PrpF domain-containing protein [Shigella flexneri]